MPVNSLWRRERTNPPKLPQGTLSPHKAKHRKPFLSLLSHAGCQGPYPFLMVLEFLSKYHLGDVGKDYGAGSRWRG